MSKNENSAEPAQSTQQSADEEELTPSTDSGEDGEQMNLMQVVGSVFAAGLGVQSSKNRERDFKQGRASVFIAAGITFTLLFIGTVYGVVSMVLSGR